MAFVAWSELTWLEAEALGADPRSTALVPLGALEQHGPHMPLATDSLIVEALARSVAERVDRPVLVTPVIATGLSDHHTGFAGTVSLGADTLDGLLVAFLESFRRMGLRHCALITAHGGNFADIGRFAAEHSTSDLTVSGFSDFNAYLVEMFAAAAELGVKPPASDVHAGAIETGLGQHLFPQLIDVGWADVEGLSDGSPDIVERVLAHGVRSVSATGVLGTPALATPELGEAVFERLSRRLGEWLESVVAAAAAVEEPSA
jgi:creatinine amidohydrolase